MRPPAALLALLLAAPAAANPAANPAAAPAASARPVPIEDGVLAELNRLRADPAAYAESLRSFRTLFRGDLVVTPGPGPDIETEEGVAPVDEAIEALADHAARAPLHPGGTLAAAAGDHAAEQGAHGTVGHEGLDGAAPGDRVRRVGGGEYVGEVIAYGSDSAADVVRQFVVDDGVPDRGHRHLILSPDVRFAGVSCGPHPVYRSMCVVKLSRTPDGRSRIEYASR